jgi:endonuclease/exonuclease/phosphatase family metal-dependent hydrolase
MTRNKIHSLIFLLVLVFLVTTGCIPQTDKPTTPSQPTFTSPPENETIQAAFLQKRSPEFIRVMSFNINWDSIFSDDDPQDHPYREYSTGDAFIRILQAVRPDVLCLQEINPRRDPEQIVEILDAALPLGSGESWYASSGFDNFIAARFPLGMQEEKRMGLGGTIDIGHALALVDLPDAVYQPDLYLICAHFKSSGGETNIRMRQAHADGLVSWIGDLESEGGEMDLPENTPIILLGDFNVYDTDPAHHLVTMMEGDIVDETRFGPDISPDWDGTALADALPSHNAAGEVFYTWRDDTQEFNPGALDRILYTDSVISLEHAFVLDTTSMTDSDLAAAGLQAGDVTLDLESGLYDHLPLVVDISFKNGLTNR